MIQPLISIIVASYNYEQYITLTLDSLLTQTYPNFEVIVVDDGSRDNSVEVIRRYQALDRRIALYTHPDGVNKGLVETLRLGISKCKGQYIAFCESDDLWTHNHLEMKVQALEKYPEAHIISSGVITFGNPEKVKWMKKYFIRLNRCLRNGLNIINVRKHISMNWIPTFSCVMFEAHTLRSVNLDAPVKRWTDIWMYQQILCIEPLLYIKHPLTLWRIHGNSQNSNNLDPLAPTFYSKLRQLMDSINGSPKNDLYMRNHRLIYLWYKFIGKV